MRKLIRDTILSYDFIAFKECNNNCTFCFQKNTQNTVFIDQDDVLRRFDILLEHVKQNHSSYKEVYIDMTGGELFFMPNLLHMYKTIFDKIYVLKQEIQKPIRCLLGTNLLYNDLSIVKDLITYIRNDLDADLLRGVFTSFDIVGRFRTIDKVELHRKNTIEMMSWLYERKIYFAAVSVLTKDAIRAFINPNNELECRIKEIYDEYYRLAETINDISNEKWWFRLSWTLMSPNTIDDEYTNLMVPSAEEIRDFYKHLIDNYRNLAVVQAFWSKKLSLRCGGNCHVCKTDIVEKSCDSNIYGSELLKAENLHVKSNDPLDIYKWLIKKYDCMSCKWFGTCYIRPCPVVVNLKTTEKGNICWRREIYEYAESKK